MPYATICKAPIKIPCLCKPFNTCSLNPMSREAMTELKRLEEKIDALLILCQNLQNENRSLKSKQNDLVRDRANLVDKTSQAKNRVEAMITRLKSMGQGT